MTKEERKRLATALKPAAAESGEQPPVAKPPRRMTPNDRPIDWGGELAKEYWKRGYKKF